MEAKDIEMPKKIVTEFTCPFQSSNMILKDGTVIPFLFGRARLIDPAHIAELKAEVAKGNPHLKCNGEIDLVQDDPLIGLKTKLFAEAREQVLAEIKAAEAAKLDKTNDMGGTEHGNQLKGALSSNENPTVIATEAGKSPVPIVKVPPK